MGNQTGLCRVGAIIEGVVYLVYRDRDDSSFSYTSVPRRSIHIANISRGSLLCGSPFGLKAFKATPKHGVHTAAATKWVYFELPSEVEVIRLCEADSAVSEVDNVS